MTDYTLDCPKGGTYCLKSWTLNQPNKVILKSLRVFLGIIITILCINQLTKYHHNLEMKIELKSLRYYNLVSVHSRLSVIVPAILNT